jgi:hypothetical protein
MSENSIKHSELGLTENEQFEKIYTFNLDE